MRGTKLGAGRSAARGLVWTVLGLLSILALGAWVGTETIVAALKSLRWVFPVLLAMAGGKHLLRTRAWHRALQAEGVSLPPRSLFQARVAAQGFGYFASMGGALSEPLKPWLLRREAPLASTMSATLVEAFVYWATALAVILAGIPSAAHLFSNVDGALALSVALAGASGGALFLLLGRPVLLSGLLRLAERRAIQTGRWLQRLRRAAEIEAQVRSFRARHRLASVRMALLDLGVQAIMLAEVWLILSAIGRPPSLAQLLVIEASSRLVKVAGFLVPGRIGTDEAGSAGAFALLGLDPASGLTLALARRAQVVCWTALGMIWLARSERRETATDGHRDRSLLADASASLGGYR